MYLPAHFVPASAGWMTDLIDREPLGLLVHPHGEDGPQANLIPFLHVPGDAAQRPHGSLQAHVARANPVWREADGAPVLVVFQGPRAYVSPGWYPAKAITGKVVPTYNYVMVQARGVLRVHDDAAWVRGQVDRLTARMEAGQAQPWSVDDAPGDYTALMLKAIVGIEVVLQQPLAGKWKISQNRPAEDRQGVASGLERVAEPGQAQAMAGLVRSAGP